MNIQEHQDFDELSVVGRFVLVVLLDATKRADEIRFERFPDSDDVGGSFAVNYVKDGVLEEYKTDGVSPDEIFRKMSMKPTETWKKILRRLKVLAKTLDDGPEKSVDGTITLRLAKNMAAEFYMTTNPNPYSDNEVTLINKGMVPGAAAPLDKLVSSRVTSQHFGSHFASLLHRHMRASAMDKRNTTGRLRKVSKAEFDRKWAEIEKTFYTEDDLPEHEKAALAKAKAAFTAHYQQGSSEK